MTWQTVIGLEVHAQLKTKSKLFSSSSTTYGAAPNSQTNFIDAGLPGVLPVLNKEVVRMAIQFGIAIHAEIHDLSFFERKNYFYPDLPKGYQISQFQRPIVGHGYLDILSDNHTVKKVIIERAHLEEDAGKSLHELDSDSTSIDLNRAGTPLLEIVTTPCLYSAYDAVAYLKTLHQLLRFLDICDGNMQEGSFRCDVNLSLRRTGTEKLGTRTELKNLNSFRYIEKAIQYEQRRHQDLLESGETLTQETRLYCPNTNRTLLMRKKEDENDYRYFPDPDLLPIQILTSDIERARDTMPEQPSAIKQRLEHTDKLSHDDSDFLLATPATLVFYDDVKKQSKAPAKQIVNWLKGTYTAALNEHNRSFEQPIVSATHVAELLDRIADNRIPMALAKTLFTSLITTPQPIDDLIAASGYEPQKNDERLEKLILDIIENHPQQAADYRAGNEKLFSFFMGQVMKQTKGQADPGQVQTLLVKIMGLLAD